MEGDVLGVRITPPVLRFFNTVPHTLFKLPITVLNISKTCKNIRYYGPKSELELAVDGIIDHMPNFSLKVKNPEEAIAPGLAVTATVEYCPMVEKEDMDRIVLTVDGNVIEVPIFAHPCQPLMDMTEVVDFDRIVVNSTTAAKEIILTNAGSKKGDFKIKYRGHKQINITPSSGTIPPHSEQRIKVEFVARTSGKFNEVADVHLEGRDVKQLCIKGSVIERALELLSPTGDNNRLNCVRFGSTYYGTDKTECALLYNNSPEPVSYTAIIDEDAIAQEMGIDLTKTTAYALANGGEDAKRGHINDITSLIAVIPNQGILKPYQKVPIFFRFSPRWYISKQGWKNKVCPPPRKDFAVFLRLQIVGSSNGFLESHDTYIQKDMACDLEDTYAEVAITATALPVLLNIAPTAKLNFGECPVGEHADVLCTIKNESNILPALFEFRSIAHFTAHPSNGKVLPGQTQDVILTFAPKQVGTFMPEKLLDVLGQVADRMNPQVFFTQVIYSLPIKLLGSSKPITIMPKPKFNPGITPFITNEVGMYVETTFKDLKEDVLRNAVAGSTKFKIHQLKSLKKSADLDEDGSAKVAFPNDRACSIRPFNSKEKCKTLFLHTDRYNYFDQDYACDETQIENKLKERFRYSHQIHERREKRMALQQTKEFKKINNIVDIGIKSAAGIFPPKLKQADILPDPVCLASLPPNSEWKILSTKELAETEKMVISKPVCDGLNAVPITAAEKKDCARWLSPQELHQVIIGPPVIHFEQICVGSVCRKELKIVNNLAQYIHVVAEIDCSELRQSSPLSQVVPPLSKAVIPIIFESNTKETFQRSVVYTVNGFYKHHVTVLAKVVPVAIELSPGHIILKPSPGMPAEAGFRSVVTLHNKLNYPAEFTWSPDLGEKGTAFSIRPASGVVEPKYDLDCEVVWHPSFMAPDVGSFTLLITGGESRKLLCTAEVGNTNVFFLDQRISFGSAPVNLTTVMSSLLHNSGNNHAYFSVLDRNPLPGLTVTPTNGVVPVGGSTEIQVALTPESVIKFDTRVQVIIRGGRTLDLRVAGSVESPIINIDVLSFNFGGVYCGSSATIPFQLENKANSKCRFEVDLTKFIDFSVTFPGCQSLEDFNFHLLNPGRASVTLEPEEVIEGEIIFTPKQVAAYDFILPVTVNYLKPQSPIWLEPSSTLSSHSTVQNSVKLKSTSAIATVTPKQVIATAMREPLKLDTSKLEFLLPSDFHDEHSNTVNGLTKEISITNISPASLVWGIDLSMVTNILDQGIFKFLEEKKTLFNFKEGSKYIEAQLKAGETQTILVNFSPAAAGHYQIIVPIVINSAWGKPYKFLEIVGELMAPKLVFEPHSIVLTPVPLNMAVSAEFSILAYHYKKSCKISASTPTIECEWEMKVSPLTVTFLDGDVINAKSHVDPCALLCRVTFSSQRPVSFSRPIVFSVESGDKYRLQVTATADNCLLTCYPFISMHRADHQIICEQGSLPKGCKVASKNRISDSESIKSGEAMLVSCATPHHSNGRRSTSTTSSNFQISSSSYESSTPLTDSVSTMNGSREFVMNKPLISLESNSRYKKIESVALSAGSTIFPDEDTEEGLFHVEVLMAVQRWFSYQGWPGGSYPILVPETVRTAICKKTTADAAKNAEETVNKPYAKTKTKGKGIYNRMVKTIYDMINFLSGKTLPGIPVNVSLPTNPVDRVRQIYYQHSTLLTFLRCQGACISSILPEFLMTPGDFVLWIQLQRAVKLELLQEGNVKDAEKIKIEEEVGEEVFEAISRKMWTDVLLQILKVLVLAKVTPKTLRNLSILEREIIMPSVNPDPLSSNIYSVGERILLAWMNFHYENNRVVIWQNCLKGGVPSSRWIVNFDYDLMDGLVLAALLGSHMPFLIKSHLNGMYTDPATAEQCLHNALNVVNAMRFIGIDYDINAIDITDPNPISLLLLVVHLYERLPQYVPKAIVEFTGSLHSVVARQVKVSNTSAKCLAYNVLLAGSDAGDFYIPKGNVVTVPSKSHLLLTIEFKSRFLRQAEAVLVLVGKRQGAVMGSTLIFNLTTEIDNIKPKSTVKVESHCYELELVTIEVKNPFPEAGEFRIVLIESRLGSHDLMQSAPSGKDKEKKRSQTKVGVTKKKPSSQTDVIPMNKIMEHKESMSLKNSQIPTLQAFHIQKKTVHLDAMDSAEIVVNFLPFHVGEWQCSVILVNEQIGELLYSIEARSLEPLPSYLPYAPCKNSVRISSAAAAGTGPAGIGNVIYWRCESGVMLRETLLIPTTNLAKERALLIIAQEVMSTLELTRRQVTGTLMSCSVMAKTLKELSNNPIAAVSIAKAMGPVADVYRVQVDSEYFQVPDMLVMPNQDIRNNCMPHGLSFPVDINLSDGVAELIVQFKAKEPGQYTGTITLTAIDDVRIYRIECTVTPPGGSPEIEFHTPVFQAVTQKIPIMNPTDTPWMLDASITGNGFHGPSSLEAKAFMTTKYPLTFEPLKEEEITGKLVLTNKSDGMEQQFDLIGKAEKPLALDQIQLMCAAKASLIHTVKVPNVTSKKLTYRVESDLPFINGEQTITVLPHHTGSYNAVITPNRRGKFKGILAFISGKNPVNEIDSDGDTVSQDEEDSESHGYHLWYSLEVDVKPPLPEKTMTVVCACHKKTLVEVIVRNPTPKEITLKASIVGCELTGPLSITLDPGTKDVYSLIFAPTRIGETWGSLIFFNEDVGEFWYNLMLKAEPPTPTTLPQVECELGSWTRSIIELRNPTEESLEVAAAVSNTNNFMLEIDPGKPLILKPNIATKVGLRFKPSNLGKGDHTAKITFTHETTGDWIFYASGIGLPPNPQPTVVTNGDVGSNTTFFIVFRNPTDAPVLADFHLTDMEPDSNTVFDNMPSLQSPFTLLLKHSSKVHIGPKSCVQIPISFAPNEMNRFRAFCTVIIRREDGQQWPYTFGQKLSSQTTGLNEIRWLFPIQGVSDCSTPKDPVKISCQVHDRLDQKLEFELSSENSKPNSTKGKTKSAKNRKLTMRESDVGSTVASADEYSFDLSYANDDVKKIMEKYLDVNLVRHFKTPSTDQVTLVFNIKFAPIRILDHQVELHVRAATGGLWMFPLRVTAVEPSADDNLVIEASGLGKPSMIRFRLNSQQKHPAVFNAFFESGSDPEFSVTPETGELAPNSTIGTLFTVTFLPNVYGKLYNAKLIVKTTSMQWSYNLKGVLPEYQPPRGVSAHPIAGPHPSVKLLSSKKNYVRENLKLLATAVSSPIKGAHLVPIGKAQN